ncbi:MAG: hypothetical protein JWR33_490 [Naasia sp.]|jgi:PKD repeat protein|uniref:PKD domain-containing protein n=1 Tax=Naasia sp. TaxID=2546198 RepID=UPI0026192122|nr:PKD domain-containing protein [Naasia sp.]MCU1569749.1 hypothetical protein [Naasia sp.]
MRVLRLASALTLAAGMVAVIAVAAAPVSRAAGDTRSVHFTASGDFTANANARAVFADIGAIGPDLHLALGDLSYGSAGQEQAWCDAVTAGVGAGFPFELISGNHESNGLNGNINDFASCLPNQLPGVIGTYGRQYYVDVPAVNPLVRFVMISPALAFPDSTWSYAAGTPRYAWTSAAIDGARSANIPWVVVGMHKPCLSLGEYSCDPGVDIMNLLLSKKVDLVLNGHEHLYQRTDQLTLRSGCPSMTPGTFTAACVVDTDASMVQGVGTVIDTVGTGGQAMRPIDSTDPEAPYFAATAGSTTNPTWGSLDVTVTADALNASFNRATGGTFTDSFTITRGTPPANSPPTATFTSACTDLSCRFDASSSSDSDGTISSYAWTFGDGSTGTGPTPSHPYGAAGSYPVTLKVTDNGGATDTASSSVSPTAPPATSVLAEDAFGRTVSSGWGSATTGGPWTLTGTATRFAVGGGVGTVSLTAGSTLRMNLQSVSSADTDLRVDYAVDKLPAGGSVYVSEAARRIGSVGAYQAKVVLSSAGKATVALVRLDGSAETSLQAGVAVPGTYPAGSQFSLRVRATGTSPTLVQAKMWPTGSAEPAAWQRSVTDSTAALQTTGSVGITTYLSGGVTNGPIQLRVDDLLAVHP